MNTSQNHSAQNPAIDAETRLVTIPTCPDHSGLLTTTVKLHWLCPVCNEPRGDIYKTTSADFEARPVPCDGWKNPCGHIDLYTYVRLEAERNGLNETYQHPPTLAIEAGR